MNCSEIKEFLKSGERPDEAALGHIRECAECSRVAALEERLSQLLKEAPGIELPADFDRVLTGRIENRKRGRAASFWRPGFLVPVAAAAVLVAVLAIAFALFRGEAPQETAGRGSDQVPAVSSSPTTDQSDPGTEAEPLQDELAGPVESASPKSTESPRSVERSADRRKDDPEVFDGGSRDLAAETPESLVPPWAAGTPETVPVQPPTKLLSPKDLFSELGIDATLENGGWRVTSVRNGSIGARTGVRKGDLIKALDGRALSDVPLDAGGKRLLVVRGNRELTLAVRP